VIARLALLLLLRPARCVAAAVAMLLAAAAEPAAAQAQTAGEYEVKAAFLYNFARFSEWPAEAFAGPGRIRLCILGTDPFGNVLASVVGMPVGGRTLEIVRLDTADDARACQIAFIGAGNLTAAIQAVRRLEQFPVLTVSEIPEFARAGGVIEFRLVDNRVRFAINPAAAQRAGVGLSSQLLRLATIVEERR
jgi:hypothetical protein